MEEEMKQPMEEAGKEAQEVALTQTEGYRPRPAYQVWAARFGLVIVIIAVILYYYHIAKGGL
jgi:hypothetical protein